MIELIKNQHRNLYEHRTHNIRNARQRDRARSGPRPPKTTPPTTQPNKTPAPVQPPLTNGAAGVTQYYQDVSDKNYAAAWAIGGSNLAAENGQTYASWVAGYADTTASISITSYGTGATELSGATSAHSRTAARSTPTTGHTPWRTA